MRRRRIGLVAMVLAWSSSVGCATIGRVDRGVEELFQARSGPRRAAVGSNQVGFDVGERLEPGNAAWSPYSITTALGMVHAGARGRTADEMADALHLGAGDVHERLGRLYDALGSATSSEGEGAVLRVANDIWVRDGFELKSSYLERLESGYGATPRRLDMSQGARAAAERINRRVAKRTSGRIEELIPPDRFPEDTVTVLVNALYLQARWRHPFPEEATAPRPFHRLDASVAEVPTMKQTERLDYAAFRAFRAVVLPYRGRLSAAVVVPDRGRFRDVAERFDAAHFEGVLDEASEHEVTLQLPRFRVRTMTSLKSALRDMGARRMFHPHRADLGGMHEQVQLYVDDVFHGTFVDVDERGTEAAAATGAVIRPTSLPPEVRHVELRVDRPFLFFVFDRETEAILFAARVVDPS